MVPNAAKSCSINVVSKGPQRPMKVSIYLESLDKNIVLKSPRVFLGNPDGNLPTTHESAHLFGVLDRNIVLKSPPGCSRGNLDEIVRNGRYSVVLFFLRDKKTLLSLPAINAMALPTQEDPAWLFPNK
ncbi:hypothetical protein CEXT_633671 [Caerostris extrusa]|uniref:Uncharacterized protein n=1 Tax=Caerostris extrusa TaxID=172846 RepID=A0AAV4RHH2_CAEEX|nr:hypothetical protein CEXT_633671 [Caerostris extrusa]